MAVVNDETIMHWQYGCKLRPNKFKHYVLSHNAIDILKVMTMSLKEHISDRLVSIQYGLPEKRPIKVHLTQINVCRFFQQRRCRLNHCVERFFYKVTMLTIKYAAIGIFTA